MVGFEKRREELAGLGAAILAGSVDPLEKAQEVGAEVSFEIAYGLTRDNGDRIGAWWEERRGIIQPSEFILDNGGGVLSATYSSGPVGRLEPADAVAFIGSRVKAAG
ncbi:MAG: hypothetical protein WD270_10790 [Acetobacterales bacterium]